MYSLEVWKNSQSCRVLGAAGGLNDAQKKADQHDLADGLVWVEIQKGRWEAAGSSHSRFVIIEHEQG